VDGVGGGQARRLEPQTREQRVRRHQPLQGGRDHLGLDRSQGVGGPDGVRHQVGPDLERFVVDGFPLGRGPARYLPEQLRRQVRQTDLGQRHRQASAR